MQKNLRKSISEKPRQLLVKDLLLKVAEKIIVTTSRLEGLFGDIVTGLNIR